MRFLSSKQGFSLIEILIVIVVIGILATIAVPKYMSVTRKAKETEAKMMLSQVHTLMEAYYNENDTYTDNLNFIGFEQTKLIKDGGKARYEIIIESVSEVSFVAIAKSTVDFDKDGTYNVWEITEEGMARIRIPD